MLHYLGSEHGTKQSFFWMDIPWWDLGQVVKLLQNNLRRLISLKFSGFVILDLAFLFSTVEWIWFLGEGLQGAFELLLSSCVGEPSLNKRD